MSPYIRFIGLVLIVLIGVWAVHTIHPEAFTKENMEATNKKEKTINAVQAGREKRREEAQRIMDQY